MIKITKNNISLVKEKSVIYVNAENFGEFVFVITSKCKEKYYRNLLYTNGAPSDLSNKIDKDQLLGFFTSNTYYLLDEKEENYYKKLSVFE